MFIVYKDTTFPSLLISILTLFFISFLSSTFEFATQTKVAFVYCIITFFFTLLRSNEILRTILDNSRQKKYVTT